MSENIKDLLQIIYAILIVLSIGGGVTFIFYSLKKRDLFGGFIGGLVIGVIGALVGGYLLDYVVVKVLDFLTNVADVNIISGFIGAYVALYVMNKLNHDKERTKY